MKIKIRFEGVPRLFGYIKVILAIAFIVGPLMGGFLLYVDIERVWNNPNTWYNPYIKLPEKIDHLKIYVKEDPKNHTISYKIDYALLYDIQRKGDYIEYKFSLIPWIIAREMVLSHAEALKKFKPDIVLKVPKNLPPEKFLDRVIASEKSWAVYPFHEPFVPVKVEVVEKDIKRNLGVVDKIKVYWALKKDHKKFPKKVKFENWLILKKLVEYKDLSQKYLTEYLKEWARKEFEYYLRSVNFERDYRDKRIITNLYNKFVTNYIRCDIEKGCNVVSDNKANPAINFLYFSYSLAHYNPLWYDVFFENIKHYFTNFKRVGGSDKITESPVNWTFISPYTFVVYPFRKDSKKLLEVFKFVIRDVKDITYLRCPINKVLKNYPDLGNWNEVSRSTVFTALNLAFRKGYQKDDKYYKVAATKEFKEREKLHPVFCKFFTLLKSGFLDRSCLAYKVYLETELSPFRDEKLYTMSNDIYYYMLPCSFDVLPSGVGYYKDNIWTLFYIYAGL